MRRILAFPCSRCSLAAAIVAASSAGCGDDSPTGTESVARSTASVTAPLAQAYCTIQVDGKGAVDAETDYLPHVIQCENGGADLQALKAQAIAARSVAYYNMATSGSICDGQGCQVYSCGATPDAKQRQAVAETAGQYLSYANMLTYGFYVAGDPHTSPPACVGNDANASTEHWVTYNEGKTGGDVEQTALGYVGPPGFGQNRGCMSQWGARCLESGRGYDYKQILQFYYGADIGILTAPGPCVQPQLPALDASFVSQGSDAAPDPSGTAHYQVCTGQPFHFWFELENTGTAAWQDLGANGSADGQNVRLGVPDDQPDPLVGVTRISINENANNLARSASGNPSGVDCNDAPGCRRTVFTKGAGIAVTAPATPGLVTTHWRLVDEGRGWFGPEMQMTFDVVECESGASGGAGGSAGSSGGGGAGGDGGTGGDGGVWPDVDAGPDDGSVGGQSPGTVYGNEELSSCACRVEAGGSVTAGYPAGIGLLVAVGAGVWRRRRRRREG